MTAWAEANILRGFLGRVSRRLAWFGVAEGAALGLLAAAVESAVNSNAAGRSLTHVILIGAALGLAGVIARLLVWRIDPAPVAVLVERNAPQCRNVVITAAELIAQPANVSPYVGDLVCNEAARSVSALDPAQLFPAKRPAAYLAGTTALWALSATLVTHPSALPLLRSHTPTISRVEITITPPPYTRRAEQSFKDPARIEALAGSRIRVTVRASAASVTLETIAGKQSLPGGPVFAGDVLADADGYIAVEAAAQDGRQSVRRLIGLSVTPDQPPRVRVTTPAHDLFFPDVHRSVNVDFEADDDIGLATLRLRYTKVSGSGEKFTFTEGEIPVNVVRADDRHWKAHGTLHVDSLGLAQGDMVVYRGVATDGRPGATPSESDTYIVEITAPGSVASEGFAVDDDRDRYRASQQMVILKTERLLAAKPNITADSLASATAAVAAEQRAVRAEFVFMMGGELAEDVINAADLSTLDESAEANGEADLAAGRMGNAGRLDLVRAIRSMSRASTALNAVDVTQGLKDERDALTYLQGAFARARYILRALTLRERLDLTRRLTGELSALFRDVHAGAQPVPDARTTALRQALAALAALAGGGELGSSASARASDLAEHVLQVDPSADALQKVAASLNDAAAALGRNNADAARSLLDRAAVDLATTVRAALALAPQSSVTLETGRLSGALVDALRHPAGSR